MSDNKEAKRMSDNKEAAKVLRDQARSMGLEIDGRWSVETLAEKVQEAQQERSTKQAEETRASSDTAVYLLRDAFPVEDEKHRKGETIIVPAEMAKYWYKAGVARPAD